MVEVVELPEVPQDYISGLQWLNTANLVVSAWDGSVSLITLDENYSYVDKMVLQNRNALTSLVIIQSVVVVGSVTGEVFVVDWENSTFIPIEGVKATKGISALAVCNDNFIVTGSWDGYLELIDVVNRKVISSHLLENKIFCFASAANMLLVVTSKNEISQYILKNRELLKIGNLEYSLNFQTRSIALAPDSSNCAYGGLDGRIAVRFFQNSDKRYAFHAHKKTLIDETLACSVNSLCYGDSNTHLYTAGSDGIVSSWDLQKCKRTKTWNALPQAIVKIDRNNYNVLAIATSDDSFKTAAVCDTSELAYSRIYLYFL